MSAGRHRRAAGKLAERTGRTKTHYAREAILRHLDDLEDVYVAEIRSGKSSTVPPGGISNVETKSTRKPVARKLRRPPPPRAPPSGSRPHSPPAEEQARLHAAADKFIGAFSGDDPTRSQRVSELVRERLAKRYGR